MRVYTKQFLILLAMLAFPASNALAGPCCINGACDDSIAACEDCKGNGGDWLPGQGLGECQRPCCSADDAPPNACEIRDVCDCLANGGTPAAPGGTCPECCGVQSVAYVPPFPQFGGNELQLCQSFTGFPPPQNLIPTPRFCDGASDNPFGGCSTDVDCPNGSCVFPYDLCDFNSDIPLAPCATDDDCPNGACQNLLSNYVANLEPFICNRQYVNLGWLHDVRPRPFGDYPGEPPAGNDCHAHPGMNVYYSPEVIQYLCNDRQGKCIPSQNIACNATSDCPPDEQCILMPPGAMVVVEMRPYSSINEDPGTGEIWLDESCYDRDVPYTQAVMVAPNDHQGIQGINADAPNDWFFFERDADGNVFDFTQSSCLRCHASAPGAAIFADLKHILGGPGSEDPLYQLVADAPATGTCCAPNGSCSDDVTQADCEAQTAHSYGGDCITCNEQGFACTALPTGACCNDSTGECTEDSFQFECEAAGNRYGGDGSTCLTIDPPCLAPPATGACCDDATGDCTNDVTAANCSFRYGGDGSTCLTIDPPCLAPPATGACCDDATGSCSNDVTQANCGSRYGGDGSTCATIDPPCEAPAVCGDNVVNQASEACDGTDDAACPGECLPNCTCPAGEDVPTVSQWGLIVLALLLIVIGKIRFGNREAIA